MIENTPIKNLLIKFVLNQCTPVESDEVVAYYQNNTLTSDFPSVEDIQNLLDEFPQMDDTTAEQIFTNIVNSENESEVIDINRKSRSYKKYISIAASIVILLSAGWFYNQSTSQQTNSSVVVDSNQITLQLENGDVQVISADGSSIVKDANGNIVGNQNKGKIVYDAKTNIEKLVYNTIKIPFGKRFQLQLSDGTRVHLNAGTTLKYPIKFIAGLSRQVFLDGEAYFDVAKDKKHPFLVNVEDLNVQVLGTHFNVSNYPEDKKIDVVLIEGSVSMYNTNEKFDVTKNTILKPGFKGSYDRNNKSIQTESVKTDVYTSWMDGRLAFRNLAFNDIAKKLERRYNVTIVNQNNKLADGKFYATFDDESLDKVLSYFNEIHGLNYTIKDNQVTIK